MHRNRPPPAYPEMLTIALLGRRIQLKNAIGDMILNTKNNFATLSQNLVVGENMSFRVFNTPDFFDEDCLHPDQQIIDLMAVSHPGPNLFILAVDSENTQEENVIHQINKLQYTFGKEITAHLVTLLPDIESFHSLSHLKEMFNIQLAIPNENLAMECRKWCPSSRPFLYDYRHYSQEVVIQRKKYFEKRRCNPTNHQGNGCAATASPSTSQYVNAAGAAPEYHNGNCAYRVSGMFNIVLLGLTGTGKSASANTILAAGNSQLDSEQLFKSEPSSMPVTTQCEVKIMEKPFGTHVRVVDTPDFFHDELKNSQAQIKECRKYCEPGQCAVLLVLQLGRFTDAERGILENLENKLGWKIRENTIVVLTHGEDLKGNPEQFINAHAYLKSIVEKCGHRYHLLNNNAKDNRQVTELIKKIPNYKEIFPGFPKKKFDCLLC